jgi:regulator of sigma E protease
MIINILVFLVVLGVLVFVHELGHFLAAKACGIYCDRFSLGMPPRVWGFRWGETDYCIGALPIGGYVKMAGQEDAPRSAEEREQEYAHVPPERFYSSKPVWQRAIVIAAGPFMNLVLAFILYGTVAAVGAEVPETKVDNRIGVVLPGSPAAEAPMYLLKEGQSAQQASLTGNPDTVGWQTGDRVLTLDGRAVESIIQDVRIDAVLGAGRKHTLEIERALPDGKTVRYASAVEPKTFGADPHPRFGAGPYQTALVDHLFKGSPAERAGLQPNDIIVAANGRPVDSMTLTDTVEKANEGDTLQLDVLRDGKHVALSLAPEVVGRISGVSFDPPLQLNDKPNAQPVVAGVSVELEEKVGLKPNDIVLKVGGQPATVALLEKAEHENAGDKITLEVRRPAVVGGLLRKESIQTIDLPVRKVGAIGVVWQPRSVFYRATPSQIIPEAYEKSYLALVRTVQTLKMLVTGSDSVRAKDIGGPVLIYQIMSQARQLGWNWLLEMTAFISINLCVFNLLPMPVLDGGQLLFLAIEGVRRKPLDMRVLERVQQMGLVVIVLLILFVTFNDISRIVTNMVP